MLSAGDEVLIKELIVQIRDRSTQFSVQHVKCNDWPEKFSGNIEEVARLLMN